VLCAAKQSQEFFLSCLCCKQSPCSRSFWRLMVGVRSELHECPLGSLVVEI
jgi:hypothetical protein